MYTVKELIEVLKQCPQEYTVTCLCIDEQTTFSIYEVGIDPQGKTVNLFLNKLKGEA